MSKLSDAIAKGHAMSKEEMAQQIDKFLAADAADTSALDASAFDAAGTGDGDAATDAERAEILLATIRTLEADPYLAELFTYMMRQMCQIAEEMRPVDIDEIIDRLDPR